MSEPAKALVFYTVSGLCCLGLALLALFRLPADIVLLFVVGVCGLGVGLCLVEAAVAWRVWRRRHPAK